MYSRTSGKTGLFLLVFLLGTALSGYAAAVSISESPDHIVQGEQVTVSIKGLPDGSVVGLVINGTFMPPSESSFTFQTSHFVMPFTLNDGEIHASVDNAKQAFLEVTKGDQMASVGKNSIPDGSFSYSINRSISAGTYDALAIRGAARDSALPVTANLQLAGVKSGPDDADISFYMDGIESGTLHVTIMVDENEEFSRDIVVGTPQTLDTSADSTSTTPEKTPLDPLLGIPAAGMALLVYSRRVRGGS